MPEALHDCLLLDGVPKGKFRAVRDGRKHAKMRCPLDARRAAAITSVIPALHDPS